MTLRSTTGAAASASGAGSALRLTVTWNDAGVVAVTVRTEDE